jgi:hypothetical protein
VIDESVHRWLRQPNIPEDQSALVVQLTRFPEEKLAGLTTAGARVRAMRAHVASRLEQVSKEFNLPEGAIEVMGMSDAVIRGRPETLRALVADNGLLATADDLSVRPNELMTGVTPVA